MGDIYQLDVEASIATNNFTTTFFDRCPYPCAYIRMCVPDPCDCLKGEWIPLPSDELSMNNNMLDLSFKFIYKHVYYDGRESEWSLPSTAYYQSARGCDTFSGFSRCIKLRIPVGNPLVDKIKIGFSNGQDIWYLTEIVDKYKKYNSSQEKWYERDLAELTGYSDVDCSFDYFFCNDRQRLTIDPAEITRVYNPMPRDVQGLINIKEALGFYNYVQGNCPIDKIQLEKLQIDVNCDESVQNCTPEYSTVTVRAVVFNTNENKAGLIFRDGVVGSVDDITKPAYYGTMSHDLSLSYQQQFEDKTRNFIAYVEGTDLWGEGKQWIANNGFTNNEETGVVAIPNSSVLLSHRVSIYVNSIDGSGRYYYQEFKIKVPKGTRGFIRLASQSVIEGVGSNQNTSTSVVGVFNLNYFANGSSPTSITDFSQRELYFDTCNGDTQLSDAFLIRDNSADGATGSAYSGYLTDASGDPVEGADISFQSPLGTIAVTDHNGYYSFHKSGADNADIYVRVEQDCASFSTIKTITITALEGTMAVQDLSISETDYDEDFFANIIVPVRDCNGNPIPNIKVALSGSKYKTTDLNGNANFKIRNYSTRDRSVRAIVMNSGGCFILDCDDNCAPCMPMTTSTTPSCYSGTPTITTSNLILNVESIINEVNGLKSGGRYEYAVLVKGDCGRISAAYPIKYIDIPKTQEKGYLGFCMFSYQDLGIVLPSWGKCLQILRSKNLNNYELQWKVDKIERTDDGKLKLTIQSLNDYNAKYGFKTNTTYQWLKGDRIEFIYNGDGTILNSSVSGGILNYLVLSPFADEAIAGQTDIEANFFNQLLILDDGRLNDVTEGAVIELQRPLPATEDQIYYSICASIPIVNGSLFYPYGTFSTFDTFLVSRVISGTSGSFIGIFEHHAPSDFWESKLSDEGKRYVANEFENERRYGRNIAINSPTIPNFFDSALVKKFEAPGQGDITAMHIVDGKVILAICENDNFVAQSADELVRVGGDGIIRALPPDAIISDAEPKLSGAFGCQYDDIGSIYFGDGYATYVDSNKNAHVRHDYNVARDSSLGKVSTYFQIRCREKQRHNVQQSNPLNKYRWSTGMNFATGEIYLTLKTPRMGAVYNYPKPYQAKNDTIIYHPLLDDYLGFASFTPEFYSQLDLDTDGGCSFIAFSNGVPFVHPVLSTRYNEFFGITVDSVVGITLNKFKEKVKRAMSIEIQSTMMWFAVEITVESPKFVSEIPPIRWKYENGKWSAGFLYNKNSRSGLFGNSKDSVAEDTRGRFINVTLVRDNTVNKIYQSVNPAKRVLYDELGDILMKFSLAEQAGLTENL